MRLYNIIVPEGRKILGTLYERGDNMIDPNLILQDAVFVFTDGAITEGHSSGSAVYGIPTEDENYLLQPMKLKAWSKFHNASTNNEAELTGIWEGIKHASLDYPHRRLYIFSDSEYCVKTFTDWIFTWYKTYTVNKRNGIVIPSMMTKGGTPVKNAQLICLIINYVVSEKIDVTFINVKGHTKGKIEDQMKYFEKANGCRLSHNEAEFIAKHNHIVDRIAVIVSNFIKTNGIEGIDPREPYIEFEEKGLKFKVETPLDEDDLYGKYYMLNHKIMSEFKERIDNKPF